MRKKESALPSVIGCLIVQLCVGILYLWSVFRSPIIATFSMDSGAARMVSSYMLFAFVIGILLGGFLNDKKGPKLTATLGIVMFSLGIFLSGLLTSETINLLNLTYCILGGLGSGFAYNACISCLQKWMPHRRGIASGLAVSAFGLSTVVFAPLSNWLMQKFQTGTAMVGTTEVMTADFQSVFFILAGVFFVLGIIGCMMIRLPSAEYIKSLNLPAAQTTSVKSYTLKQAVTSVPFWCIFFGLFFINGTWLLIVPYLKDMGMNVGLEAAVAVFTVSFTGVTNAGGRLIMAGVSDKIGRPNTTILMAVVTLICALLLTVVTGGSFIVIISLIAFCYGSTAGLNAAMTTDFYGPKYSGTNYGVITIALGLSSIFYNWVSGLLLKGASVPTPTTFIFSACTAAIPIILMLVIKKYQKTWKTTEEAA